MRSGGSQRTSRDQVGVFAPMAASLLAAGILLPARPPTKSIAEPQTQRTEVLWNII